MDMELVKAFERVYDAMYERVSNIDVAPLDESLDNLARNVLTDDEYIEYTEGYDKEGNAVFGR